ncbi:MULTISPECIES: hypothetical protein, partial [Streptomyces]|uniref:hypothetical protein n=1 Tax=Streptomyces TaxID=1883 RepID=UPI00345C287A
MTISVSLPIPSPAPAGAGPRRLYRVAGLDISLTGTGIATVGGTTRVPTRGHRKDSLAARRNRLKLIADVVVTEVGDVDLAAVEGPVSYSQPGGSTWDRAGLWWQIVDRLIGRNIPV